MAMLAEPRQRKRYNLVPKGKPLYEDASRFGTKMLEKMGWKKGDGLGAGSDGSKDFVRIRYKNDCMGLGFEHRDDQWTQHEQYFNGLLKTLNNEENDKNLNKDRIDSESEMPLRVGFGFQNSIATEESTSKSKKLKEKISGISLEERSKSSKARVHYKKYTRGKDLSQYSEKDLANIFGKKPVDEQQEINDFYKNLNVAFGIIGEETYENKLNDTKKANTEEKFTKKNDKAKKKTVETKPENQENKNIEPRTYNSSLSVQEYFKLKMEAFKNKKSLPNNEKKLNTNHLDEEPDQELRKKKKKNRKKFKYLDSEYEEEPVEKKESDHKSVTENDIQKESEIVEKKKKPKKRKIGETTETHIFIETKPELNNLLNDENLQEPLEKKSKTQNKFYQQPPSEIAIENDAKTVENVEKSKISDTEESKVIILKETIPKDKDLENVCVQKTALKKSKKNKNQLDQGNLSEHQNEVELVAKENKTEEAAASLLKEIKCKNKKDTSKIIIDIDLKIEDANARKKMLKVSDSIITKSVDITDTKKKKDKKKCKEIIEIVNSDEDEPIIIENRLVIEDEINSANEDKLKNSKRSDICSSSGINTKKEESSTANNLSSNDIDFQVNDLEEIKKRYQAFNIYSISTFCAEKFRNVNLDKFEGSALSQIEGYGFNHDINLNIIASKHDEERITKLWTGVINKYQPDKPKNTYKTYVHQAVHAFKKRQKPPKLNVKTWRRKNAFNLI